jgi:hypothetical protein
MPHLPTNPAHLGLGATATVELAFTNESWYAAYGERARRRRDRGPARLAIQLLRKLDLVGSPPHGAEMVICTAGGLTIHQEHPDGTTDTVNLAPGDYAINPPGTPGARKVTLCGVVWAHRRRAPPRRHRHRDLHHPRRRHRSPAALSAAFSAGPKSPISLA